MNITTGIRRRTSDSGDHFHRLEARAPRHPDVEHDDVGSVAFSDALGQDPQQLFSVFGEGEGHVDMGVLRGQGEQQVVRGFVVSHDHVEGPGRLHHLDG